MKSVLTALIVFPSFAQASLMPLGEHVDVLCHYVAGAWSCNLRTDSETYVSTAAFLPLADKPTTSGGARSTQPATQFAFTGAQTGAPLWMALQGSPGIGEAWPGFANDQPAGTFGSYIPTDLRVSQGTARPWIRISLVDYQPPHGKTSYFSMWTKDSGKPPTAWMSTYDTNVENSFYYSAGSHIHLQWGFTQQGIHRVTLRASAFLGPGATNPTGPSEPFTLVFAVGTVARWQAESFDITQLADPSVSALTSDPENDGLSNLLEYSFGTHPLRGGTAPIAPGLGMPIFSLVDEGGTLYQTITYPRRRAGLRLQPEIYQPFFANSLAETWTTSGVVTNAVDFPTEQAALNAQWEKVTSRRPVPSEQTKGFARVGITAGDGFTP